MSAKRIYGERGRETIEPSRFLAGLCVLAVSLLLGCTPPGPRALLRGKELVEKGRYTEAIEKLQTATSLLSTNAHAWNYLGLAYHGAGDFTNAAQAYGQALKLDRDLVETHFNLGCLWLDQDRFDSAKSEFSTFVLRRPDSAEGWVKLGTAQLHSRDLTGAEKSFTEAIRLDRHSPEALNEMGMVLYQRRRSRDAAAYFNAALKEQPDYAPALLNMAIVSETVFNNLQYALQKYREYLALSPRPGNWEAVNATARALEQQLTPPARSATLAAPVNQAVATAPSVSPRTSAPPVSTANTPNKPESGPSVTKSEPQRPPQTVSVPPPAEAHVARDETPKGSPTNFGPEKVENAPVQKRGFFQKMNPLNLFKHNPQTANPGVEQNSSGVAKGAAVRSNSSSPTVARFHYQHPQKPAAGDRDAAAKFFSLGLRDHKDLHYPEAIQEYRKAIAADPSYFEAYYNLALAALASGDLKEALTAGETALAIRPDSLDTRLNFAQSLKQAGYAFDAANELAVVLAANPNDPRAHLALGNLYAQEFHQPEQARQHYLKVLELDPQNPQCAAIREWIVANPAR